MRCFLTLPQGKAHRLRWALLSEIFASTPLDPDGVSTPPGILLPESRLLIGRGCIRHVGLVWMGITELKPLYCFYFTATAVADNSSHLFIAAPFAQNCHKFNDLRLVNGFTAQKEKHRAPGEKQPNIQEAID